MRVIVKTDTGLTFEHKDASAVKVASWIHVIDGSRERMYNPSRVLWVETDKDSIPKHKTTDDLGETQ